MALIVPHGVTLYFCRHGETEANVQKRFQGRTMDTPLTATGRAQTAILANLLRREATQFAELFYVASPLRRAQTTMHMIRSALDLAPDAYSTDERLQEIDLGAWDGLTHEEARAKDAAAFEKRETNKWDIRLPGDGENYADVAARATSFVQSLSVDTFAVAHGGFTRILRGLFDGLDWKQMSALDEKQGVLFRVRDSKVERFEEA